MKRIIWFVILIGLFSCTAKKIATKSDVAQTSDIATTIATKVVDTLQGNTKVDITSSDGTETTITTVVYDTEKPVEDKTGKPPIKSETKKVIKKDNSSKVVSETVLTTVYDQSNKEDINANIKTDTSNTSLESPKTFTLKYIFYILGVLLLGVAAFFIYKKFPTIESFFGF